MNQPQHTSSYYFASAIGLTDYPQFTDSQQCDVCVVGGGYTGLSTALNLAEQGFDTVLLEARRVGWGASGRNGGQLGTGMNWHQSALEKEYGKQVAAQLWTIAEQAKHEVKNRIVQHNIDCDFKPGVLATAVNEDAAKSIESNVAHLRENYDHDSIRYIQADEIQAMLGTSNYYGGALDTSAGHLHPLNLAIGLANSAAHAGVRIYENSAVSGYRKTADGFSLQTQGGGAVKARYVVLACNAYIDRLVPPISRYIMPIESFIVATQPLSVAQANEINRDDVAVYDSKFCLDYYRLSGDRRLIFGGGENYIPNVEVNVAAKMKPRMLAVYPQLKDAKIDYAWRGKIAITLNRLPSIGRVETDIYYAQGFSGHGVALTNMVGKILADTIAGTAQQFDVLATIRHRSFPGGNFLRWPLHVVGMYYYALADRISLRGTGRAVRFDS